MENNIVESTVEPTKNTQVFDKIIEWCIYLFIFLTPLWFLPFTRDILNFHKQALMVILITVALIAWLSKLLTKERVGWHKNIVVFFLLAFVIIYGISTIFSVRPYNSLMGFDNHLSRSLINVIYFFIFFLLLVNYKIEEENRSAEILKLLGLFLLSSFIVGIIGLFQMLGINIFPWSVTKTSSFNTIGSATGFGMFLATLLPTTLCFLFSVKAGQETKEKKLLAGFRILLGIITVLTLVMILIINSSVLWIALAISMFVLIGFWLFKRHSILTQGLGWLTIPVVTLTFCLIFVLFKPGNLFNINLPAEVGLSQRGGLNVIKEVIKQSPILGTGPETFVYNYSLYKPAGVNQTIFWNIRFTNAPSEILSLLSEIGILGVLALLISVAVFIVKMLKNLISAKDETEQMPGLKIGLFSTWLTSVIVWFIYPQSFTLYLVFWLFLALLTIISSKREEIKMINLKAPNKIALLTSFGFIIIMIATIGLLYLEGSRFIAEAKFQRGLDLVNNGKLDDGINKGIKATITNPYEDRFYNNLAQFFLLQINQNINNENLSKEEQTSMLQTGINNAITSATRATALNAKDVSNWIVQGLVYKNLVGLVANTGDWAIKSYEEALKLEPENPFTYTEIARTYAADANLLSQQAQTDKTAQEKMQELINNAIGAYNKAIDIKSDYATAHFELALLYAQLGQIKEAIAGMEKSKTLAPKDTGVAFQLGVLYYKNSQFDKAKTEFTRAIGLDSNFSNARYFLGLLFDKEGNRQAAIEQFNKIAELNPDNEQIKQILANLNAGKPALGSNTAIPGQPKEVPIEEKQPDQLKTEAETRLPQSK